MTYEIRSDISDVDAWKFRQQRVQNDANVASYPQFEDREGVQYDQETVHTIYDRLVKAEEEIAPGGNYETGSAWQPDEILTIDGGKGVLLTAEHATTHQRAGEPKEADMGTGGLAKVVAEDTNTTALIASGRQTSDAYHDPDHPIKPAIADIIRADENRALFALHMLDRGRASEPEQTRGYSVLLGIGDNPSEATLEVKDQLLRIASDFDLKIDVNKHHLVIAKKRLKRNPDGTLKTITFKAAGANATRTYSQALAKELEKDKAFAAIQFEINEVLLARQNDDPSFPSDYDRYLGSYLGYMFMARAVGTVALL